MPFMKRQVALGLLAILACAELFAAKVVFDKDCLPEVLALIRSANKELIISVFDINEPQIVDALMQAHFRGVRVRILTDRRQAMGEHSRVPDLLLMGLEVRLNSRRRLHHNKFAVADGVRSVSGSFNWTNGAARNNSEDLTVLETGLLRGSEKESIGNFQNKFLEDWVKNTRSKSDGYFTKLFKEKGNAVFERWRPWVKQVLEGATPANPMEDGRLREAIDLADVYYETQPELLGLVARHATDSGNKALRSRMAAIEFLGDVETRDPAHHALIQVAEHDSREEVRTAAIIARMKLGGVLEGDEKFEGARGSPRRMGVYCRSLLSRLR